MNAELRREIDERMEIITDDPDFAENWPGATTAELEICVLEDIINLGPDCGGCYELGILPTYSNPESAARAKVFWDNLITERKAWGKLLTAARRELKTRRKATGEK